jgi:hypothetical protein
MANRFDLTTQLSFSIAAGASKALRLDRARSAAAASAHCRMTIRGDKESDDVCFIRSIDP